MDDDNNETEDERRRRAEGEGDEGRGEKGKGGTGAPPAVGTHEVSPELSKTMGRFGLTMAQITNIFKNWQHLQSPADLQAAFQEFSKGLRQSAQMSVDFVKGKFTVVTDFLAHVGGLPRRFVQGLQRAPDNRQAPPRGVAPPSTAPPPHSLN